MTSSSSPTISTEQSTPITETTPTPPTTTTTTGFCCWYFKYGKCEPPRPPCRFRHQVDDGTTPCCFGATCRMGHAKRVLNSSNTDMEKNLHEQPYSVQLAYWQRYHESKKSQTTNHGGVVGASPAERDATLLRSQLEPWPTAVLRRRLAAFETETNTKKNDNNNDNNDTSLPQNEPLVLAERTRQLDPLGRAEIMQRLLGHYEQILGRGMSRRMIRVQPNAPPLRHELQQALQQELQAWRIRQENSPGGGNTTRPSIAARAYMILRSPREFESKLKQGDNNNNNNSNNGTHSSRKAKAAALKWNENATLWHYAEQALREVDPTFANHFSALAVTYGFVGSPHIDKQNTGPFYGLSLGNFDNGQGGICVEANPWLVAHVNTKHRLAKVDGRFPHWVAPYEGDRYSLIYYSTWQTYQKPTCAYFGQEEL